MSALQVGLGVGRSRRVVGRLADLGPVTVVAAGVVAMLILVALFGPLIAPHDPTAVDPLNVYAGSSSTHLLGTDDTGRDILSRLIYGARPSLVGPAFIVAIAVTLGSGLALAAAWFGGWVDAVISRALDILFAFPGLILAIGAVAMFGPGLVAPVIALAISYTPYFARVLRSAAVRERRLPYVDTAWVQGVSARKICFAHLLPNLLPLMLAQASVAFGYALLDLAAVSFLGLGVQPPTSEWGLMVANGQPAIVAGHPQQALYAGMTVLVAVVAFNVLGEGISRRVLGKTS
ncbi:MAG TPA: ABC transporter permease [Conexibacter sp.]|nr:ABC transporter permease [Conexibacter sp.]